MAKRIAKAVFSVAMSKQDGCLVMIRTNGTKVTVMGALDKAMSQGIARAILDWHPENATNGSQPRAYPH